MLKDKKLIAVYGSLREGEYNYERFKEIYKEGFTKINEGTVEGFALYSLGSYPGIRPEEGKTLRVDVMECNNQCFQSINSMELGAGYSAKKVTVNGLECTIYVYDYYVSELKRVESGDWSQYLKSK